MRIKMICMAAAFAPAIFGITLISPDIAGAQTKRGKVFLSRDDCQPLTMSNLELCCSALNSRTLLSRATRSDLCPPQYTAAIGNDDDPGDDDDNTGDDDDNTGDDDDNTGDDDDDTGDDDDDTGRGNPGNTKSVGRAGETPSGGGGWNEPSGGPGSKGRSDGNGKGGGKGGGKGKGRS